MHFLLGWHRAVIEELVGSEHVSIFYIDFGTRSVIPVKSTRYLLKKFCEMPAQAIRAKCGGIKTKKIKDQPKVWDPRVIKEFSQMVTATNTGIYNF